MTRRTSTIDAHALGVAITDENGMDYLLKLDKERLIERHQAHMTRVYTGISRRAAEHREEVSRLEKRVQVLHTREQFLERKINWIFLALAFFTGLALYFMVKDVGCPALSWIARVTQ